MARYRIENRWNHCLGEYDAPDAAEAYKLLLAEAGCQSGDLVFPLSDLTFKRLSVPTAPLRPRWRVIDLVLRYMDVWGM